MEPKSGCKRFNASAEAANRMMGLAWLFCSAQASAGPGEGGGFALEGKAAAG